MLPFMTLQPLQLDISGKTTEIADLQPSDAIEPVATFADLLQLDMAVSTPTLPAEGTPLPPTGNALPSVDAREIAATAPLPTKERMPSAPVPLRLEFSPGAAPDSAAAREALTRSLPPPQGGNQSAATSDPAKPGPMQNLPRFEAPAAPEKSRGAAELTPAVRPERPATDLSPRPAPDAAVRPVVPPMTKPTGAAAEMPPMRTDVANPQALTAKRVEVPAVAPDDAAPRDPQRELLVRRIDAMAPPSSASNTMTQPAPVPAARLADINAGQSLQVTTAPVAAPIPASSPQPALPTPQLHTTIDVPVRDAAWPEQLGERVQLMANSRLQTAEIRLTPAELGPVRVQVAIDDGTANVTFQAQHAITREVIEQALPRLRELLAEGGLTLNQANVDGEGVEHGSRQAGDSSRDTNAAARPGADTVADNAPEGGDDAPRAARAADGLVDTFA